MAQFIASVVTIVVVATVILLSVAYCILLERKIASWTQDRIGPNRVGFNFGLSFMPKFHFWGLGQPLADGLKFLLKEDFTPGSVDKILFAIAPMLAVVPAMIGWAVIPWGGTIRFGDQVLSICAAPVDIGLIYILAVGSMAVYGVVVGGYASNSKYSFLGGMRATAQMLSYEVPLSLSLLTMILISGTARADMIVQLQTGSGGGVWNLFYMPVLAVVFFACGLAETNRAPFDLAEAEQELVGGYHTEYGSMKFALFFLGEYMHMITAAAFFTTLFLGGWSINPLGRGPDLAWLGGPTLAAGIGLAVLKFAVYAVKIFVLLCLMMLIRWTLPRFRFDQLMRLAWGGLVPITLTMLLVTGGVLATDLGHRRWVLLAANIVVVCIVPVVAALLPKGAAVNRRVSLAGSRFSPLRAG
jgi:NADH-quinone oxidoreductase subunit H